MVLEMNTLFWHKVRTTSFVRAVCMPYLLIKRKINFMNYRHCKDSQYIETLKGSCNGERCFIIGNGPSLNREDLSLLKDEKTFAFNRIYQMYQYTDWRPTYYMAIDRSIMQKMYQENEKELCTKHIFFASKALAKKYKRQNAHWVLVNGVAPINLKKKKPCNICEDVSQYFSLAQSVTINALEFAFYMGFKEIYLLGIDHCFAVEIDRNGHKHFNQGVENHFKEDNDKSQDFSYKETLTQEYIICKKYADEHGIHITNVTRGGKLEVFERDNLEHILQ